MVNCVKLEHNSTLLVLKTEFTFQYNCLHCVLWFIRLLEIYLGETYAPSVLSLLIHRSRLPGWTSFPVVKLKGVPRTSRFKCDPTFRNFTPQYQTNKNQITLKNLNFIRNCVVLYALDSVIWSKLCSLCFLISILPLTSNNMIIW